MYVIGPRLVMAAQLRLSQAAIVERAGDRGLRLLPAIPGGRAYTNAKGRHSVGILLQSVSTMPQVVIGPESRRLQLLGLPKFRLGGLRLACLEEAATKSTMLPDGQRRQPRSFSTG